MKKAKVILTAIVMLAVVGGVLAFKARKGPIFSYSSIGVTVTSTTISNVIFTTTVRLCTLDDDWFIEYETSRATYSDVFTTITGVGPNGVTATWQEISCVPTFIFRTSKP